MSRFWRPAAGACLLAFVAAWIAAIPGAAIARSANQSVIKTTARVQGRVVMSDTAMAVANIPVTLSGANGLSWVATTDDHGVFEFRNLPPMPLTLRVKKAGYVPVSTAITSDSWKGRETLDLGVLRLARAGVIAGRVVDMYGDPVVDIPVQAWRLTFPNPGDRRLAASSTVMTNDLGEYRLFGLMPGMYFVSTGFGKGFASMFYGGTGVPADAQSLVVQPGDQALGIDMSVRRSALLQLSGTVIDSSGQAGSDSFVVLSTARQEGASGFTLVRVETDDDGRFRFLHLLPGDYQLDVVALASMAAISTAGTAAPAPGRVAPEFASMPVALSDQAADVAVRTSRGSVLRGRVTIDGQRPPAASLSGMKVTTVPAHLVGSQAEPDVTRAADVSDDGTFMVGGLSGARSIGIAGATKGMTLLRITVNGSDVTDDGLSFDRGDVEGVEIALTSRPALVKGHVADVSGRRVAGHVVVFADDARLHNRPRSRHVAYATVEAGALFTIGTLPPGQYLAIAVEDLDRSQRGNPGFFEWLRTQAEPFTLADGETKTLALVRR